MNEAAYADAPIYVKTKYGWKVANAELEKRLKQSGRLVGKLMQQWLTEEEVLEMDGLNGRPHWVMVGRRVFDVTGISFTLPLTLPNPEGIRTPVADHRPDFRCRSDLERSYLYFLQNPLKLGSPHEYEQRFLDKLGDRIPEMHRQMEEYICGTLREQQPKSARLRAFTANEVGWHINRDHRMFIIILERVYDVTGVYNPSRPFLRLPNLCSTK